MKYLLILALVLVAGGAFADTREDRLLTPQEAQAYRAVGRLNVAGSRFCTATLISPQEIVTAAHCLFQPRTGVPVPLSEMRFVAGLYRGEYTALRRVEAVSVPADFVLETENIGASLQWDIALLRLDAPVDPGDAIPLSVGATDLPRALAIVGYSRERAFAPSVVERCHSRGSEGNVIALSCRVTFGASGAPVIDMGQDGREIYAITSAVSQAAPNRHGATYVIRIHEQTLAALRSFLDQTGLPGAD